MYLDHTAKLSGGELALLRLLPYLDEVEAHVILAEDGPLRQRLQEAGISVEVLAMSAASKDLRKDDVSVGVAMLAPLVDTVWYTLAVARRLRELDPDVVHTNSLKSGVYGALAGRLVGTPVVWHVRDRIAEDYLPRPAVFAVRAMLRVLPSAVIANSQTTAATVGPVDPIIVHSAITGFSEIPDVAARASGDGAFRVGIVGRLAPWKGQDLFLEAFADAFGDGDERAVVVGAAMFGEDAFAESLVGLAARLGIAERVDFRGFADDVPAELRRLDVLVHASRSAEPFGQVVLEGLAAGVPVIASAGGGPSEIITDQVNGLLFASGDRDALAGHLLRLRAYRSLRTALTLAGRQRAQDYSPTRSRDRVQETYRRILAQPGRRPGGRNAGRV